MRRSVFVCGWVVGILIVTMARPAGAAPIPGLFNTGVNNGGVNLPSGAVDPHWVLSVAPAGAGGPNAIVSTAIAGVWVPDTAGSQWIANAELQSIHDPAGTQPMGAYRYDLTFDLTGLKASTASISGDWSSDNASQILLNEALQVIHSGGAAAFRSLDSFNLTSGFVPGINKLSVVVVNDGGPTGVHVLNLSGTAEVPEPGSFVTAVAGFAGLLLPRRRCVSGLA